jgi:hypothetical protein
MKRIITTLFLSILLLPAFAQKGEKIESLKVAFISEKLNLDATTAQKFWPIYNQYDDEMKNLIQQRRQQDKDERSVDDILDQEQHALDIKKKYASQFSKILSAQQVNQLFVSEKEFRKMIMKRAGR